MRYLGREDTHTVGLTLDELKILYRSLWNDLKAKGTLGIDEEASDLLHDIQSVIQPEATRLGVDLSLHSEWAEFVGIDNSCAVRKK